MFVYVMEVMLYLCSFEQAGYQAGQESKWLNYLMTIKIKNFHQILQSSWAQTQIQTDFLHFVDCILIKGQSSF